MSDEKIKVINLTQDEWNKMDFHKETKPEKFSKKLFEWKISECRKSIADNHTGLDILINGTCLFSERFGRTMIRIFRNTL